VEEEKASFLSGINRIITPPAETNFERDTLVSWVTLVSIILDFMSIICQTLRPMFVSTRRENIVKLSASFTSPRLNCHTKTKRKEKKKAR